LYENVDVGLLVYDKGVYNYKTETPYLASCDDEHAIEKGELYERLDATNMIDVMFVFLLIIVVVDLKFSRGRSSFYRPTLLAVPCILARRYAYMLLEFDATISSETIRGVTIRLAFALLIMKFLYHLKKFYKEVDGANDPSTPQV
jgi:hypothetical protein